MIRLFSILIVLFIGFVAGLPSISFAQDRINKLKDEIEVKKLDIPALDELVEISVDEVRLEEFIRGLAKTNKLNVSVDPGLDVVITNNFVDVSVADIFIFLAEQHSLDIRFIGTIINFSLFREEVVREIITPPSRVEYFNSTDEVSFDFSNIPLYEILKEITRVCGKNVIANTGLEASKVSAFIQKMPFNGAIEKFALSNNLDMTVSGDGYYILSKKESTAQLPANRNSSRSNAVNAANFEYSAVDRNNISVHAVETPLIDVVRTVSTALGINYYLISIPDGNISLNIKEFTYDNFLIHLFKGSKFTFRKVNDIYLLGDRVAEDLRDTRIVELQHRSIEKVVENIPAEIKTGVTIKEFNELNCLILSGSLPNILEIERFIHSIDKIVPVVLIEVMIVDYSSGHSVSTGISAGIGESPAEPSTGQVFPSLDYKMDASSVNNIVESLNGFGWFKLGKVTPNFYLNIRALEEQGVLKVRSTPKLATLNGNEANLSIGNTEYYAVESNNVIGSQNPQNIITRSYQSVNADLTVTIKPFVSGDEQITLDITVQQSDFTARVSPDAPPGSVTRSFSSLIRVKNEEMVLLGGLEQKSIDDSGSGVPLLSRIPVIKWFFSSRSRSRKVDKLNIFIKPTVFY